MRGTMNEYRPLDHRFRLAMPYHPGNSDWRSAAIEAVLRAARFFLSRFAARA